MKILKIISGGQTGADQGALEAAVYCDIPYGGWIPKGRKAEKGLKVPAEYDHLVEMTTGDDLARTEANVVDSDATLVLTYGKATGGSKKTMGFAEKHGSPCCISLLMSTRSGTAACSSGAGLKVTSPSLPRRPIAHSTWRAAGRANRQGFSKTP